MFWFVVYGSMNVMRIVDKFNLLFVYIIIVRLYFYKNIFGIIFDS